MCLQLPLAFRGRLVPFGRLESGELWIYPFFSALRAEEPRLVKTTPIGWGPEEIGLRGHVFVNDDESTVVVSLKGTNVWLVSGGGPTTKLVRTRR